MFNMTNRTFSTAGTKALCWWHNWLYFLWRTPPTRFCR